MKHARDDYNNIQDTTNARKLAYSILKNIHTSAVTNEQICLACSVLGLRDLSELNTAIIAPANSTTHLIPKNEPVFLIRAQDAISGMAVREWCRLAKEKGANNEIINLAYNHSLLMDIWPEKKTPDL